MIDQRKRSDAAALEIWPEELLVTQQSERPARGRRLRTASVMAALGLAGCAAAPSQNILGSYFPSWMLCVFAGIGAAILVRQGLVLAGINKVLPAPLLVYIAFSVFFAFAAWLAWLN